VKELLTRTAFHKDQFLFFDNEGLRILVKLDAALPQSEKSRSAAGLGTLPEPSLLIFLLDALENLADLTLGSDRIDQPWSTVVSDADQLAERLISDFETLPWGYTVFAEMPFDESMESVLGDEYAVGEGLNLVKMLPDVAKRYAITLEQLDPIAWRVLPPELQTEELLPEEIIRALTWRRDRYYLRSSMESFLPSHPLFFDYLLIERDNMKSLAGLALACDVLEMDTPTWDHKVPLYLFRESSDLPIGMTAVWMPPDEAATFGALKVRAGVNDPGAPVAIRQFFHEISFAFRSGHRTLINAGLWFFSSFCGSNQLLQLVQATTTLEILLGGTKAEARDAGLVTLLANRCAFYIASSRTERQSIIREVEEIYDTRSRIIHSGENRLAHDRDTGPLDSIRELCKRVIRRELRFITPA
jgi:hypothetical protein